MGQAIGRKFFLPFFLVANPCICHTNQRCMIDTIQNVVDKLEEKICREGLSSLCESNASVANLAMPRRQEIFACLNRYRGLNL